MPPNPRIPVFGPADTIDPVCGVPIVSTAYAVGPASPANITARIATAASLPRVSAGISRATTATTPTTRIAHFSHGTKLALRPSSTHASATVDAAASAIAIRTHNRCRSRHSITLPIPTSAATAGESATV
ncbi:unannotated protein [freshwater metagenome]|uniref:Unannotated protein n=1 Tax=freshwater metagenome TaxID=449393 RepID=A0A6J7IY01_9ZZZZ